jgi:hypothetical protein
LDDWFTAANLSPALARPGQFLPLAKLMSREVV